MSEENSFQMSQDYDVIPPKKGKAYPILCEEWEYLKSQVKKISTSFGTYHTLGSLLLGAAVSTLIAILLGGIGGGEQSDHETLVIAWAVVVCGALIGLACLYFAHESRAVAKSKASDVVAQMDLIEKRYETEADG